MSKIEKIMNAISDVDWTWWPFLFLRPAKDQFIDNSRLIKISIAFGSITGVLLFFIIFLYKLRNPSGFNFALSIFITWVLFFAAFKFTFAHFWNLRAGRLKSK